MALFLPIAFLSNSKLKKLKGLQEKYKCISSVPHSFWEAMQKKKKENGVIWKHDKAVHIFTGRLENWKRLEERNTVVGEKGRE